jgi:hypothetical protein
MNKYDGIALVRPLLAIAFAFAASGARADEPLPAAKKHTVCSPSKKFCAVSDPKKNITTVTAKKGGKALWSIPGWHRSLFVSDNGESLVVGYNGLNLVPVDVTLAEPMLRFYKRDKLVRMVTLGEFYKHKSQLQPTVSHLAWGHIQGFNGANQLGVVLYTNEALAFSVDGNRVALTPKK